MNLSSSSRTPVRRTADDREERRVRIMAMVRSGLFSYEAIAREHQLTRTRIRQIVAASAPTERSGARVDQMRVRGSAARRAGRGEGPAQRYRPFAAGARPARQVRRGRRGAAALRRERAREAARQTRPRGCALGYPGGKWREPADRGLRSRRRPMPRGNASPKPLRSQLIVDLLNRGVSVAGIAAREGLGAKRSLPGNGAARA
jgi:hypothetical protein